MSPTRQTFLRRGVHSVLRDAVGVIKDKAIQNAESQNWHPEAVKSIFTFADPQKGPRKRTSALVGIGKWRTMLEWRAGRTPPKHPLKDVARKVAPGGRVAMALATMLEMGTSKMRARPAFRPALTSSLEAVADHLEDGIAAIIEAITRKPARPGGSPGTIGGEFL